MDESILMNYLRGGCNDEECQQVELWCEEAPEKPTNTRAAILYPFCRRPYGSDGCCRHRSVTDEV